MQWILLRYLKKTGSFSDGDTYHRYTQLQPQGDPADYQSHYTKQAHPGENKWKLKHL